MSARSPIMDEVAHDFATALDGAAHFDFEDPRWKPVADRLKRVSEDFEESLIRYLRDSMGASLAWVAREAAGRAIDAVLKGDEQELRRWLSCDRGAYTGRSGDGHYARSIDEAHPVIHGVLFETDPITLRKKIVDAHPELLKTERILDLEDQVKCLTAASAKQKSEIEALRDELRGYRR